MRVLDAFRPRGATWSPPLCVVARGAGAAGPVLLACRQWDPLGLARRLPSLRVWGVAQCATTALAGAVPRPCVRGARGRFGGLGPVPGVVSLPFPPSRPACPALRVAGRPVLVSPTLAQCSRFQVVCAFCELDPVALLVVPACPLRVCALALPRRPLPPPLGGVACAPRAVPALGAGRAVPRGPCPSVCPAPVPCSVWRPWGGRSGPRSPLPGFGLLLRGASEVRRSPSPDCPSTGRVVGVRYPRAVGAGVWVVGAQHCPLGLHALCGLRAAGVVWWGAGPGGGWPATVLRTQALSLHRRPVLWGGQPGYRDPCVPGAVGAGVGTQNRFHSVRPCGPALLAVGVAEGRPRGGCLPLL